MLLNLIILWIVITIVRYIYHFLHMGYNRLDKYIESATGVFGTMGKGKDLLCTYIARSYNKIQKRNLFKRYNKYKVISSVNSDKLDEFKELERQVKNKKSFIFSNYPIKLEKDVYSYSMNISGLAPHMNQFWPYVDGDMLVLSEAGLVIPSTDYKYLGENFYSIEYLVKLIRHMFDGRFILNEQHPSRIWVSIREKEPHFIQIKKRKQVLKWTTTRFILSVISKLIPINKVQYFIFKLDNLLDKLSIQHLYLDIYTNLEDYNKDLSNKNVRENLNGEGWHLRFSFWSFMSYDKYDSRAFQFINEIFRENTRLNNGVYDYEQAKTFSELYLTISDIKSLGYRKLTDILSNNYKFNSFKNNKK